MARAVVKTSSIKTFAVDGKKTTYIPAQRNMDLKKHVGAIHVDNRMGLLQRKAANVLLLNALPELSNKETHSIRITELCKLVGFNSQNLDFIKETIDSLRQLPIRWNLLDDDGEAEWVTSSVIAEAKVKAGVLTYSYGPEMRKRLSRPDRYAILDLNIQNLFDSSYALALWENCYRYAHIQHTSFIEIPTLRMLLGAHAETYNDFRYFSRLIKLAVKEVNDVSNILLEPEYLKEGRSVVAIKFHIELKRQGNLGLAAPMNVDANLIKTLVDQFGISNVKASEICMKYPPEFINEKIDLVRGMEASKQDKVFNPAGFLIKALEMDYKMPTKLASKVERTVKDNKKREEDAAALFQRRTEATELYAKAEEYLDGLPADHRETLFNDYLLSAGSVMRDIYHLHGRESAVLQKSFLTYISKTFLSGGVA